MSDLPAHVRRDLDAAANGKGRKPTYAHPDCTCVPTEEYGLLKVTAKTRAECPAHGPGRRAKAGAEATGELFDPEPYRRTHNKP